MKERDERRKERRKNKLEGKKKEIYEIERLPEKEIEKNIKLERLAVIVRNIE